MNNKLDNNMDKLLKLDYFERLISDNHSESYFIEQFLKGSGNELKKKFWSSRSSSRLCFDLYSWLCNEPKVNNFQFEKQLPGVKTGKNRVSGVPNMDVYFEYGKDLVFIESKYTEKDSWKYMNDEEREGYHLSEAYWGTNEDGYKSCKMNIGKRFYDNPKIAEKFSEFCEEIQGLIDNKKQNQDEYSMYCWFDPKQETCHLFGIIFYVLNNDIRDRNIHLCNNVWRCEDSKDSFTLNDSIVGCFKNKAENMLNDIFKKQNCTFTFEVNTIQDILSKGFMGFNFSEAKLFAREDMLKKHIESHYTKRKR